MDPQSHDIKQHQDTKRAGKPKKEKKPVNQEGKI